MKQTKRMQYLYNPTNSNNSLFGDDQRVPVFSISCIVDFHK